MRSGCSPASGRRRASMKNVMLRAPLSQAPGGRRRRSCRQLLEYRRADPSLCGRRGDALSHKALKEGKTVLLEGQLGSMKDPDLGICPMTTSSHTLAGFGTVGALRAPHRH